MLLPLLLNNMMGEGGEPPPLEWEPGHDWFTGQTFMPRHGGFVDLDFITPDRFVEDDY